MTCSIDECQHPVKARGMCVLHYRRWRINGHPLKVQQVHHRGTPAERFAQKVDRSGDCWLWQGALHRGYGYLDIDGRNVRAHRFAYELANGPIPDGLFIDHICHTRNCVNPEHLRPATAKQNAENLSGARRDNSLGVRGVYLARGRYRTRLEHHGRGYSAGTFDTLAEADRAIRALRAQMFTHDNAASKEEP